MTAKSYHVLRIFLTIPYFGLTVNYLVLFFTLFRRYVNTKYMALYIAKVAFLRQLNRRINQPRLQA